MGDRRRTGVQRVGALIAAAVVVLGCTDVGEEAEIPGATAVPAAPSASATATTSTTTLAPVVTDPPSTEPPVTEATTTGPPASTQPSAPTEPPPPPTPPPTVEDPFLRIGDEGDAVAIMQVKLVTLDYLQPGYTEGLFDRATADALIDFQAQYGLIVDGIFGPETDRSLSAAAASVNPDA